MSEYPNDPEFKKIKEKFARKHNKLKNEYYDAKTDEESFQLSLKRMKAMTIIWKTQTGGWASVASENPSSQRLQPLVRIMDKSKTHTRRNCIK